MTNYLGHEFENGKSIRCGAIEKSARQFQAPCSKTVQPLPSHSQAEATGTPKDEQTPRAVPAAIEPDGDRDTSRPLETGISSQVFRYRNAYLIAKATAAIGGVIKGVGIALGVLIIAVAVIVGGQSGSAGLYFAGGLLLGAQRTRA